MSARTEDEEWEVNAGADLNQAEFHVPTSRERHEEEKMFTTNHKPRRILTATLGSALGVYLARELSE